MGQHLLTSTFDKLNGAEQQLASLKEASMQGAITDLLKTRTDRDRKGRVRVRVEDIGEIPPEWFVRIGECLYDMRSALDHLAYALNVIGSGEDPPPNWESSQFPLYSRGRRGRPGMGRAGFRAMCNRPARKCMIGYFPRGARTRVERLQPYHRRNDDDAWRLGELVALSNIDKHRRPPITWATSSTLITPRKIEGHPITRAETFHRRLKPNTTIMRFEVPALPSSLKEPQVDYGYGADIEFEGKAGNPPVPLLMPHELVWFVLGSILRTIRGRVVSDFERFF